MVLDTFLLNQFLSPKETRLKSKLIKRINMDNERQLVKGSGGGKCKRSKLVAQDPSHHFPKEVSPWRGRIVQPRWGHLEWSFKCLHLEFQVSLDTQKPLLVLILDCLKQQRAREHVHSVHEIYLSVAHNKGGRGLLTPFSVSFYESQSARVWSTLGHLKVSFWSCQAAREPDPDLG